MYCCLMNQPRDLIREPGWSFVSCCELCRVWVKPLSSVRIFCLNWPRCVAISPLFEQDNWSWREMLNGLHIGLAVGIRLKYVYSNVLLMQNSCSKKCQK